MIGNDVIDLKIALANKKSGNSRFLEKVFSEAEIEQIKEAKDSELLLWQFWSMKEAAYKAHQRKFGTPRKLNPKAFACNLDKNHNSGNVIVDKQTYLLNTVISSDYIHSSTSEESFIEKVYYSKSYSKEQLIEEIASEINIEKSTFHIKKTANGSPFLDIQKFKKKVSFSLSHHGNFTAFIIPLIKS